MESSFTWKLYFLNTFLMATMPLGPVGWALFSCLGTLKDRF
jgi:hypothetical protein